MRSRFAFSSRSFLASPLALVVALCACGCGSAPVDPGVDKASTSAPANPASPPKIAPPADTFAQRATADGTRNGKAPDPALQPQSGDFPSLTFEPRVEGGGSAGDAATPTLADVLSEGTLDERGKLKQQFPPPPEIDPARAQAAGLRILEGKHLRLVTDLPPSPEIDSLPGLFDKATPLWAEYLDVSASAYADWKVQAYLMDREEPFRALGLYGGQVPDVRHGFQQGLEFWVRRQEEPGYYQRHLFLHEGVHAFMSYCLGGIGPPWYAEGMAELLATHRIEEGKLTLPVMPRSREEVPLWGRTKVLRDAWAASTAKMPEEILSYGGTAHRETEAYAWSWALCLFLSEHPASKEAFAELSEHADDFAGDFTERLREALKQEWPRLQEDWMLLAAEMDYGYDVAANVPVRRAATPLESSRTVDVATNAGWQSTGAFLTAGDSYRLAVQGSGNVAVGEKRIPFGPSGVTLWYLAGRPYGEIQYAIVDETEPLAGRPSPLLRPSAVGEALTFAPERGGTLYLRSALPSSLRSQAQGEFSVELTPSE
ncbi:MAG TPA: hypothetical protein VGN57_02280 [Pirellulaceae bacterium]|jgi:hypothetical protein|nr:hypothetical protein [Pirellulaceae bacterium]